MNIRHFGTMFAVSLVSISSVQAADSVVIEPPMTVPAVVSQPFSWAGFYYGGQLGGFASNISADSHENGAEIFPKLSGFVGGAYAGGNIDFGKEFILGVDMDVSWSGRENAKTVNAGENDKGISAVRGDNQGKLKHTLKRKWSGAVRVRVGSAADRIMPYISGGIACAQLHESVVPTEENKANEAKVNETKMMIGYTVGAGVDFAVVDDVVLRTEYRYSDFGKKKFAEDMPEISYRTNELRVGLAYKF